MKRPGIRLRILVAVTAVIGALLVATQWVMGGLVDRYLEDEISDTLRRGRRAWKSFDAVRSAVLIDQARSLAQAPHLRAVLGTPGVDEATVGFTLSALGETVGGALLLVTDGAGRLLADSREHAELPVLGLDQDVLRALSGQDTIGIRRYAGEDYLVAWSPIRVDSAALGALGLGHSLADHVRELGTVTGLDVTLLEGPRVVASSWSASAADAADADSPGPYAAPPWSAAPTNGVARVESGGHEVAATAIVLSPPSYRLVLTRPLDGVLATFRRAKSELVVIGLAIAALAAVAGRWIANRIAGPIRALTEAANRLAGGDLTAAVPVASSDEIGTLAASFNDMARRLESAMHEVVRKARAAEQASDAKSAFLATMSHELRTPLNAILGFNEQLQSTALTPEQRDWASTVQRAGEELLALIDELLEFARMESGDVRLQRLEFDVRNAIQRAVDARSAAIRAKGLELEVVIDDDVPRVAVGAGPQVCRVLSHYLDNALKFTAAGRIAVRASIASRAAGEVVLRVEVADTGIGVAPARVASLFQPFSQLESGANRSYAGTGVGLAIAKELVALLHGEVGVRSDLGRGSTFWFTARLGEPSAPTEPPPVRPSARAREAPPLATADSSEAVSRRAGERILLAEDNPVNQRMASVVLRKAGWECTIVDDGRGAVDAAAAQRFDLILMDCQMPRMDGLEATRRIRASSGRTRADVPIVALTANALDTDRLACERAGMNDFVAKPFRAAELVATIERWIRSAPREGAQLGPQRSDAA